MDTIRTLKDALFLLCLLICPRAARGTPKITIVTVPSLSDNPMYGYAVQGPALDVAFARAVSRYPGALGNASLVTVYRPDMTGMFSCLQAVETIPLVAMGVNTAIQQNGEFLVVISSGCSLEAIILGDFAREWDVPLLSILGSDARLTNTQRFPTLISFAPSDSDNVVRAALRLLDKFSWTTVTMLCDSLKGIPGLSTFYTGTCRNFAASLEQQKNRYTTNILYFDSGDGGKAARTTYEGILRRAESECRVVFVMTAPQRLRDILIVAHDMNMTSGDFIFLAVLGTKAPLMEDITWSLLDNNDMKALIAFQSLIVLKNPDPDWERITDILTAIKTRSALAYNRTLRYSSDLNDLTICAYEVFTALAEVLNENIDELSHLNAEEFRTKFLNRTFNLPSRDVFIPMSGMRVSDAVFERVNTSSGELTTSWRYNSARQSLMDVSDLAYTWRGGQPPVNNPRCGYTGDRCSKNAQPIIVVSCVVAGSLLCIAVVGITYWKIQRCTREAGNWWMLDESTLKNYRFFTLFNGNHASRTYGRRRGGAICRHH